MAGRSRGAAIRRRLGALAARGTPIVAGPWMGEVGFEILYWAPFLRWFASEFQVAPGRLTVVSRGGTAGWYAPVAGRYQDVLHHLSPSEFRQSRRDHATEVGEQKQTRITTRERSLLDQVLEGLPRDSAILHPSVMYELMNPFWWRHLDERWILRHARYQRLAPPPRPTEVGLPERYIAAKFYYNDCFPATDDNRAIVSNVIAQLAAEGPVVLLTTGVALDDHRAYLSSEGQSIDPATIAPPSENLRVQSAIVANADRFVGTYGGFSYLAPFYGVPCTAYYADATAFSRAHLTMAHTALASLGTPDLLDARQAPGVAGYR